ncbi:MAG TPA: penicillin-binding protein 1C [Phnomibacter sp.]|nr:penicillin-binding protein 1C [Phnomibacter sp.]
MRLKYPALWWQNRPRYQRMTLRFAGVMCLCWIVLNLLFPLRSQVGSSPMVFDRHGALLYTRLTADEKWRLPLQADELTPLLERTILAREDRWFYYHPGVNPVAVVRAAMRNLWSGRRTSGASTITMQVARLLHPRPRTYSSKVIEMFRALQLEMRLSKKEILRLYLNLVPYGGNIEGISSAAWFYLQKAPDHLSLAEITALSVIPNRPNSLTPGRHNDNIVAERNRWLKRLAKEGYFTKKEIEDALNEPFACQRQPPPRMAPHLSLQLQRSGQEQITSTLELNMQLKAETIVANYVRTLKLRGIRNAAVIVVHNRTREVLAYVGSADFLDSTDAGQVNGANAWRQPGSTLKPLVYGLAIDAGWVTPKKVIADVPVNYGGYVPENYDLLFNGQVSMEYALMHSLNIPAVNMLKQVGKDKMIQSLAACGFEQVKKDQHKLGLSLILGGCGTSLEELTGLYCMLANNGLYLPLKKRTEEKQAHPIRILSNEACFMLHEMLSKTDRPDLPVNWAVTENLPRIAWKTGTSYGRRDAWSIGYNKHYTIGVWVGNFSGAGNPDLSGATIATPLLFSLFNAIDKETHTDWYTAPDHIDLRIVCAETGMLPTDRCDQRIMDHFIPLVSSTEVCNNKREVMVSMDLQQSFCTECAPDGGYQKKWYTVFPPEIEAFKMNTMQKHERIPMHNATCKRVWAEKGPIIRSPRHQGEYMISRQHPEPLMLQCQPDADVAMVHWYINNKHYRSAPARERVFFLPEEGMVKISCTDDKGRNRDIRIGVRFVDL